MSQRQREEGKGRDDAANDEGTKERGKSHALMPDAASASAAEQQGNSVREERHGSADPSLSLSFCLSFLLRSATANNEHQKHVGKHQEDDGDKEKDGWIGSISSNGLRGKPRLPTHTAKPSCCLRWKPPPACLLASSATEQPAATRDAGQRCWDEEVD